MCYTISGLKCGIRRTPPHIVSKPKKTRGGYISRGQGKYFSEISCLSLTPPPKYSRVKGRGSVTRSCLEAGPESCPKLLPKAAAQSCSPALLPKVVPQSCSPKLLPQSCDSANLFHQNGSPKPFRKAAPKSCAPNLLPKAAVQSYIAPKLQLFKPIPQNGSPKLSCKAAPESCSRKLLLKATPRSCL